MGATTITIDPDIRAMYTPHFQIPPLESSKRKEVLNRYPRIEPLPQALIDGNGLATRGIKSTDVRSQITNKYPAHQRDVSDLLRVAVGTYQRIRQNTFQLSELPRFIADIIAIASDNGQRLAKAQLDLSINTRQQQGANSLVDREKFDVTDLNVIQESHVKAISQLSRFKYDLDKALPKGPRNTGAGRNGNGRGGRGNGNGRRPRGGRRNNGGNRDDRNNDGNRSDPNP